jgi:hypothetical protein
MRRRTGRRLVAGDRVVGVGVGQDPRDQRDLLATQAARHAAAVPARAHRGDGVGQVLEAGQAADDLDGAELRAPDRLEVAGPQQLELAARHRHCADAVEQAGPGHVPRIDHVGAQRARDLKAVAGDPRGVATGAVVPAVDQARQRQRQRRDQPTVVEAGQAGVARLRRVVGRPHRAGVEQGVEQAGVSGDHGARSLEGGARGGAAGCGLERAAGGGAPIAGAGHPQGLLEAVGQPDHGGADRQLAAGAPEREAAAVEALVV